MQTTPKSTLPRRNFYGRIKGKGLKPIQQEYLGDLAHYAINKVSVEENPHRKIIKPDHWFTRSAPLWLEIGFGAGEHLIHQALSNPHINLIGCEPYVNGVATCLGKLRKTNIDNLRLYAGDARDLLDVLPKASVQRCFLLYPDPWPKARHHRRRFVTREHLEPLARVLAKGAIFRVATDIPDYVRQALQEILSIDCFVWLADSASDWRMPWADWHRTRYEQKALREGRCPHYLTFRRC